MHAAANRRRGKCFWPFYGNVFVKFCSSFCVVLSYLSCSSHILWRPLKIFYSSVLDNQRQSGDVFSPRKSVVGMIPTRLDCFYKFALALVVLTECSSNDVGYVTARVLLKSWRRKAEEQRANFFNRLPKNVESSYTTVFKIPLYLKLALTRFSPTIFLSNSPK